MANNNMFIAPIYGVGRNSATPNGGLTARYVGFPSQSILVNPILPNDPSGGNFNTVTVNSVITLLPTGTIVNPILYYTSKTVAEVVTLANT